VIRLLEIGGDFYWYFANMRPTGWRLGLILSGRHIFLRYNCTVTFSLFRYEVMEPIILVTESIAGHLFHSSFCLADFELCFTPKLFGMFRDNMQLRFKSNSESWEVHVKTAWAVDPRIALALVARFPGAHAIRTEVTSMVQVCLHSYFHRSNCIPIDLTVLLRARTVLENRL